MSKAVIISGSRTAIGSFGGSLAEVPVSELGRVVIESALERAGIDRSDIEEVIMGNVLQAGAGMNPARQSAIAAGIPESVPSFTVNKVCGSGLKAVALAAQAIIAGDADLIVAGGMESMSRAPYLLKKARWGYRLGADEIVYPARIEVKNVMIQENNRIECLVLRRCASETPVMRDIEVYSFVTLQFK